VREALIKGGIGKKSVTRSIGPAVERIFLRYVPGSFAICTTRAYRAYWRLNV